MNMVPQLLLVNSISADRSELRVLLEFLPVQITEVESGLEAVAILQDSVIDLIVTAIAIGEFDGWQLARLVRTGICQQGRSLPLIVVDQLRCKWMNESAARDFEINHLLPFSDRQRLPALVQTCLARSVGGLEKKQVLVIENQSDQTPLVEKILQPYYQVDFATEGSAGLALWQQKQHDLILYDLDMPGMSSSEVLAKIMEIDAQQPLVGMSCQVTVAQVKSLLLEGAANFISKPLQAERLLRVCELAIRRADYAVNCSEVVACGDNLQQLNKRLGNIVDSMPSVLIGIDSQSLINLWNLQAVKNSGISAAVALGQPLEHVWPGYRELKEVPLSLAQGEVRKLTRVAHPFRSAKSYCDITIFPLPDDELAGAVILVDDITERVLLEERIIQSEKMVSMGQLAAGIAHEINNPLAGVMQNTQVIRHRLAEHSRANMRAAEAVGLDLAALAHYLQQRNINDRLDAVMESGSRAAQLTENMLRFSRRDNVSIILSDLAGLIDKSVELAAGSFSLKRQFDFRTIKIQREYADDLPLIECNPVQVQQVVLNLLLNGAYAMEEKRQSQLEVVGPSNYRPGFILRTEFVNHRCRIEIEDNGMGFAKEKQARIFEPFYTTKDVGEGTGLGLSICYFIVTENHRGSINVESIPNVGTKFTLDFPLISE